MFMIKMMMILLTQNIWYYEPDVANMILIWIISFDPDNDLEQGIGHSCLDCAGHQSDRYIMDSTGVYLFFFPQMEINYHEKWTFSNLHEGTIWSNGSPAYNTIMVPFDRWLK